MPRPTRRALVRAAAGACAWRASASLAGALTAAPAGAGAGAGVGVGVGVGVGAGGTAATSLYATWQQGAAYYAGLLVDDGTRLRTRAQVELPTRAHGLLAEPGGSVLVAARRPGDWLLRWHPASGRCQWDWAEGGDTLNGHLLRLPGAGSTPRLLTSATDPDSGEGLLQLRDAASLRVLARWSSGGRDPHAMLLHGGRLWVANGGIATAPETGRSKLELERMDSSLAALDLHDGRRLGQWRLDDPRLSLRHLAGNGALLGVAMQAEHDDPQARRDAPLLAVFDGEALRIVPGSEGGESSPDSGGYGGDIAALGAGFVVSGTRGNRLLRWQGSSGWLPPVVLPEAGALAACEGGLVAAGRGQRLWLARERPAAGTGERRIDNHWVPAAA